MLKHMWFLNSIDYRLATEDKPTEKQPDKTEEQFEHIMSIPLELIQELELHLSQLPKALR